MSHAQQDPAAASAPFDSRANGAAIRTLAQGRPSDVGANGIAMHTLAQDRPSDGNANGGAVHTAAQNEPREIAVVARKFSFEPSRIEVTEGERVRLVVTSADIPHGIEIKKFKVDKTIPRGGKPVAIEFTASVAGEYPIICSEYCGQGHDEMKGSLVVVAKAQ
jgi:cytochrome c oxidase subunit 2